MDKIFFISVLNFEFFNLFAELALQEKLISQLQKVIFVID